jgi:hypothetical protein
MGLSILALLTTVPRTANAADWDDIDFSDQMKEGFATAHLRVIGMKHVLVDGGTPTTHVICALEEGIDGAPLPDEITVYHGTTPQSALVEWYLVDDSCSDATRWVIGPGDPRWGPTPPT